MATLGLSAVRQILIYAKKTYTPDEEARLIQNIGRAPRSKKILSYMADSVLLVRFVKILLF